MISFSMKIIVTALAAAGLLGTSMGHIMLAEPVPFSSDLDTSPLANTQPGQAGSNYPCKQPFGGSSGYQFSSMNILPVDTALGLKFSGSASHSGGTCQLAISLDEEPTANSTFKIIQVYQGGCPINTSGNSGTLDYTYSIPKDFPSGRATFAWVWFNKVGNREIYMNCAPIEVTGGADNKDYYDTLPNMYVINLPTATCESADNDNVQIPNPGQFVLTNGDAVAATGTGCGAAASAQVAGVQGYKSDIVSNLASAKYPSADGAQTSAGSGGSSGVASTLAEGGDASTTAAGGAGAYTPSSSLATPTSAPVTSAAATPVAATSTMSGSSATSMDTAAPTTGASSSASSSANSNPTVSVGSDSGVSSSTSAVATGAIPVGTGSSSSSTGSSSGSDSGSSSSTGSDTGSESGTGTGTGTSSGSVSGGTCSQDGAIVCNGSSQFGICNFGTVVWQAVAAGTTCSNGQIQKRAADTRQVSVRRAQQLAQCDD